MKGDRFTVRDSSGETILHGRLKGARGRPAPYDFHTILSDSKQTGTTPPASSAAGCSPRTGALPPNRRAPTRSGCPSTSLGERPRRTAPPARSRHFRRSRPEESRAAAPRPGPLDHHLGRNPYGSSFVVGYGPKAPKYPHHWGSVFGAGVPAGAVVGGPAPLSEIRSQGFPVRGRIGSPFATYEDRRNDYVTSEPAIDYSASSILLLAALVAHC